jgi:sensory rhodopsin
MILPTLICATVSMLTMVVLFAYFGLKIKKELRYIFYIAIWIPIIASLAYLCMTLGIGKLKIDGHSVYLTRYLDWLITTPLIIVCLSLVVLPKKNKLILISEMVAIDILMIVSGIAALYVDSYSKYILFFVSSVFFIIMYLMISQNLRVSSKEKPYAVKMLFERLFTFISTIWAFYPIIWVLSFQGLNLIDSVTEVMIYFLLDISAKGIFGYLLLSDKETIEKI